MEGNAKPQSYFGSNLNKASPEVARISVTSRLGKWDNGDQQVSGTEANRNMIGAEETSQKMSLNLSKKGSHTCSL